MPYEKVSKNEPVCIADEVPFDIPDTWEWVRLGSIGETNIGLTYKPSDKVDESKGIAVLRSNNIQKGKMDYSDLVYVSCSVPERAMINKGDILICARNGSRALVGKSAIVDTDGMAFGAFMAKYTSLFSGLLNQYILTFIESPVFRIQLDGVKTETINQITQDMLKEQLIPIPPLKEQHRINKKLKEIMPLVEKYGVAYFETTKLNDEFPELLKKSILQEAVQGKLVPQDENDEPASVLLDRIRAEKQALIKAGKIKKDKNESVIFRRDNSHYEKRGAEVVCIDNEIPFEIPYSWEWVRLGSLVQVNPRNNVDDDTVAGFIPMPLIQDGFNNHHACEKRKWKDIKSGFTHFANGDVVIAKITPCFQNRKSAIIKELPNGVGAGTTELHVLRDNTNLMYMPYLLILAKTHEFIENGMKNFTGTAGQQRVGKDFISSYLIPLPPVNEQKRIVKTAMSLLENISQLAD